jgi:hypothetical protein
MADYECKSCDKSYKSFITFKTHLKSITHLKNMGIAVNVKTYTCNKCKCIYKNKRSRDKHVNKCTIGAEAIQSDITLSDLSQMADGDISSSAIDAIPAAVKDAIINKWKAENPAPSTVTNNNIQNTNTSTNSHNDNRQINITNNYMVAPFGKEDISHITKEQRRAIIDKNKCAYESLSNEIYKNQKNHNIIFADKRLGLVEYTTENGSTEVALFANKIKDLIRSNISLLSSFLDECEPTFTERRADELADLIDKSQCGDYDKKYSKISKDKLLEVTHSKQAKANVNLLTGPATEIPTLQAPQI